MDAAAAQTPAGDRPATRTMVLMCSRKLLRWYSDRQVDEKVEKVFGAGGFRAHTHSLIPPPHTKRNHDDERHVLRRY